MNAKENKATDKDSKPASKNEKSPTTGKPRGRIPNEAKPMRYEEHYRQMAVLRAIQKASDMGDSVLERALDIDVSDPTNAGRDWRDWKKGKRLCQSLDSIFEKADTRGWVDAKTREIYEYTKKKKEALEDIAARKKAFKSKRIALLEALNAFREACKEEYERADDPYLSPVWFAIGDSEEDSMSFPLTWPEFEREFENVEHAMRLLKTLYLNIQYQPGTDPETGKYFFWGHEYLKPPQAKQTSKKGSSQE